LTSGFTTPAPKPRKDERFTAWAEFSGGDRWERKNVTGPEGNAFMVGARRAGATRVGMSLTRSPNGGN
jgi:hypothetical protein